MESDYSAIKVELKSGNEQFFYGGRTLDFDVFRFWQWSTSDLVANTVRGVLAEYIVANALGIANGNTRIEWDAFDLLTSSGIKVEVKSSSYIQTWHQKTLSKPLFGIQPTRKWNPLTNKMEGELQRKADVYVFCVLAHQTQESLNPLDLDQWEFFVLPTSVLNEHCPFQKSISLNRIISLGAVVSKYDELASRINEPRFP